MSASPRVSVVVSTYQRADRLPRLFAGLEAQTLPAADFEVVVVDNGATDDTRAVLAELVERTAIAATVVTLPENRGPSGGRNAGWRAARGEVVAFTDDDCVPTPGWLQEGLAAMPAVGGIVVGRTAPAPDQLPEAGPFSRTQNVRDTRFLQTCNVFYRRSDIEEVGGFDEEGIRAKGGEDTDLGWRLQDRGRAAVFAEQALVHHDVSPSSYRAALREAATWVDIPRVKARHPERAHETLHRGIFWRPAHETAVVGMAGVLAALLLRRRLLLVLVLPWLHHRARVATVGATRAQRLALAPAVMLIDAVEVTTMVRGSIRHRVLVL